MISPELADRLCQYYKGKMCSIMTSQFALPLDATSYPQWFTVVIDDIDREAILGTDFARGTKHVFFFGPQLLGIAEEQVISPQHPDYEKIKHKFEEKVKNEQNVIRNQAMPTKPEQLHSLQPIAPSTKQMSAIDKISQQAAEIKKKWATSPLEQMPTNSQKG